MVAEAETAELDRVVRLRVYEHFIEYQRPPTVADVAEALATTRDDIEAAFGRLDRAHMLVLGPGSREIHMAMPFSAVPTPFEVSVGGRTWWANCAWDALGIPVVVGTAAKISASCADCGEPIELGVGPEGVFDCGPALVHYALPVARWWDDIFFT